MKRKIDDKNQRAFQELASNLIFTEKNTTELNSETIVEISEKIQKQIIDVFDQKYNNTFDIGKMLGLESRKESFLKEDMLQRKPYVFIDAILGWFSICNADAEPGTYDGMGFTPLLASLSKVSLGGLNCVGRAILMGAFCKARGIKIEMGITSDHPIIFAHIHNNVYIVDSKIEKARGKFKSYGKYKIFYPENKNHHWKMIFVHDFDRAVVYEILENFEAFRKASLANNQYLLPRSTNEVIELITKNEVIQKGNWGYIQQVLFPEILQSYVTHKKKWEVQVKTIQKIRTQDYVHELLGGFIEKAVVESGIRDRIPDDIERGLKIMSIMSSNQETTIVCLMLDIPLPEDTEEETKLLLGLMLQKIAAADAHMKRGIKKKFIRDLVALNRDLSKILTNQIQIQNEHEENSTI